MTEREIIETLRAHDLRPTPQRVALYRYLLEHPTHPTAETIHEGLQLTCSLMTVYNGLDALVEAGLIRPVTIEAGVQRFDGTVAAHGHFRCTQCGTVYDFPFVPENMQISTPDGFQITDHDLYCMGVCSSCNTAK